MSLLYWNYRGLGNPCAIRALQELIKSKDPCLVFLCETKVKDAKARKIQKEFGFKSGVTVDYQGRNGGLPMWWNEGLNVSLHTYSQSHIDMLVRHGFVNVNVFLTGFYGCSKLENRETS